MEARLTKKPSGVRIIEGFPGFGLIGTITTEFLIEHLKAEQIGSFVYDELPATVAVHKGKLIDPMAIYYDKKYNLIILHTILNSVGLEWTLTDSILDIVKELKAKEIIGIEGVSSAQPEGEEVVKTEDKVFYYSSDKNKQKSIGSTKELEPLKEGIIIGVTGALMLRADIPVTCFFGETHSELPDSKSAAQIIKTLDKHLGLNVNPTPLLKQAEEFEAKFKNIFKQSSVVKKKRDKKQMSYLG